MRYFIAGVVVGAAVAGVAAFLKWWHPLDQYRDAEDKGDLG